MEYLLSTQSKKINQFSMHPKKYILEHDDFTSVINPPFQDTLESGKGLGKRSGPLSVTQHHALGEKVALSDRNAGVTVTRSTVSLRSLFEKIVA